MPSLNTNFLMFCDVHDTTAYLGLIIVGLLGSVAAGLGTGCPGSVRRWISTSRTHREKLIKIGAKVIKHSRYVIFQMAEVMVSKALFREILERIRGLAMAILPPRTG